MGTRQLAHGERIRVLAVDHTVAIAPFRKKFEAIAQHDDIDLPVLAPAVWRENYRPFVPPGTGQGYAIRTGKLRAYRVTGKRDWLISRADAEAYIAAPIRGRTAELSR